MKRIVFLLDTENENKALIEIVKNYKNYDYEIIIHLFYTENTANLKCKYSDFVDIIRFRGKIICHECLAGDNALDFQLCAELGLMLNRDDKYIIVSADKGYIPVVKYLCNKNFDIKQLQIHNEMFSEVSEGAKLVI